MVNLVKKVFSVFVLSILAFVLITFLNQKKQPLYAYDCGSGYYCMDGSSGTLGPGVYVITYEYDHSTGTDIEHCTYLSAKLAYGCSGSDDDCSGGYTYYTNSSCNQCSYSSTKNYCYQGCCTTDSSYKDGPSGPVCGNGSVETGEDCESDSNCGTYETCRSCDCTCYDSDYDCGPGCGSYYTSNQGYGSLSRTCTDNCGYTDSDTCYCGQCTPDPCPSGTSSVGAGMEINQICTNDCGVDNTNYCNYDCYDAKCEDLQDVVDWYDSPPATGSYRTYTGPVPITTSPSGLAPGDIDCPTEQTLTCYTPNEKPTLDIEAISDPATPVLQYTSATHTGRILNNPNTRLVAEYVDPNGQDDIRKIYIWWKTASGSPLLSKTIDNTLTNTSKENSFGILITRNASGTWQDIYVPNIPGSTLKWTRAGQIGNDIYINGPTPRQMIRMSNIIVNDDGTNSNMVTFGADMRFEFDATASVDIVDTGQFNLWGMADDYVVEVLDDTVWLNSSNDRNLDMIRPTKSIGVISDSDVGEVEVILSASDDDSLSYVRLDACKDGYESGDSLIRPDGSLYTLKDCDIALDSDGYKFNGDNITTGDSLLGNSGGYPGNPLNVNTFGQTVNIGLGTNDEGSITFVLTVMDMAGNNIYESSIYRLEQWAVVEDALIFGKQGASSSTRSIVDPVALSWNSHDILKRFDPAKIDFTNQALLGYTAELYSGLRDLVKITENSSFKATGYSGILISSPFVELSNQYEIKRESLANLEEVAIGSDIQNNMSNYCGASQYCVLRGDETLNIQSGFVCDKKGLILVDNNVVINPNFNSTTEGACIILARGNITINNPSTTGTGTPVAYDEIEAFLIAGESIEIPTDGSHDDDALFVEGGLVGFTVNSENTSVYNTREVIFNQMGSYPVLVVQGNSKFGILSKEFFGSQVDIYQREVGLKPF